MKQRLLREAQQEYERGYKAGVSVGGEISWGDLELLSTLSFSPSRWILRGFIGEARGKSRRRAEADRLLKKHLGWTDHGTGLDTGTNGSRTFERGVADALRDLFEDVLRDVQTDDSDVRTTGTQA